MSGYGLYYIKGNAGVIDWVYCSVVTIAAIYLQMRSLRFDLPHMIHTLLIVTWGIRITYMGIKRIMEWPEEDSRYVKLRQIWGASFEKRFFLFWPL